MYRFANSATIGARQMELYWHDEPEKNEQSGLDFVVIYVKFLKLKRHRLMIFPRCRNINLLLAMQGFTCIHNHCIH